MSYKSLLHVWMVWLLPSRLRWFRRVFPGCNLIHLMTSILKYQVWLSARLSSMAWTVVYRPDHCFHLSRFLSNILTFMSHFHLYSTNAWVIFICTVQMKMTHACQNITKKSWKMKTVVHKVFSLRLIKQIVRNGIQTCHMTLLNAKINHGSLQCV